MEMYNIFAINCDCSIYVDRSKYVHWHSDVGAKAVVAAAAAAADVVFFSFIFSLLVFFPPVNVVIAIGKKAR